ncbi:hypothetical protein FMN63_18355 [Stappia sp. BW2]|uniref:hypothetical protein n=1 Tax=Stappia sp. BW2 TaxID=2592622 RepID=UPI0011DEAA3E|nr:hypothetical protein [Stappia sp. BW2]TYC67993.1 hypothetical protein FMN63_18355 [Stappia sp. BW2]
MNEHNKRKPLSIAKFALQAGLFMGAALVPVLQAEAQTRRQPDTTQLTCVQTQGLIKKFGAINLKSGPYKFDRFVVDRNRCFSGQTVRPTFVPTKDDPKCAVLVCAELGQTRQ